MSEAGTLELSAGHQALVAEILRGHLPAGAIVHVFGSRANGRAKRYSDIDLLVDAGGRLDLAVSIALADAFDESDLPYKVDVVDLHGISPEFRAVIERTPMVRLRWHDHAA
jgi:predicted nucleotidyltransferase